MMLAASVLGLAMAGSSAAAPARGGSPTQHAALQEYCWHWEDTNEFSSRTFTQASYPNAASLPRLVVELTPATPSRMVYLEFYQGGVWSAENIMRTDASGRAVIGIDPYCEDDEWCDGTYKYRIRIGGLKAPLTISYFEH